jgi:hypothetical protein
MIFFDCLVQRLWYDFELSFKLDYDVNEWPTSICQQKKK